MSFEEYRVSVHELMHKPGQMRELKLDIVVPEDIGTEVIAVPSGAELDLDLRLESVHEGILATGELFADSEANCSRCLDPIMVPVEVDFQELFAYSVMSEDDYFVEEEQIDLEPVIRDAIVLILPFQPVCNENCPGLCPDCGEKLADNPHHVHEKAIDSRWDELKKLQNEKD